MGDAKMGHTATKIGYERDVISIDENTLAGGSGVYIGGGIVSNGNWVARLDALNPKQRELFGNPVMVKSLIQRKKVDAACIVPESGALDRVRALLVPATDGETISRTDVTLHYPELSDATGAVSEFYRLYLSDHGRLVLFSDGYLQGMGDPPSLRPAATDCRFFTDGKVSIACIADDPYGTTAIKEMLRILAELSAGAAAARAAGASVVLLTAGDASDETGEGFQTFERNMMAAIETVTATDGIVVVDVPVLTVSSGGKGARKGKGKPAK